MKEDNLAYDLKHLMATDISPINEADDLKAITRDNIQLLVSQIFQLPREQTDIGPVVRLDKLEFVEQLPRMMPLPKPKVKSRWQKFAEERGIDKKKRSRLVWDEASKDWVPRWGANSVKHKAEKQDWLIEVPLNSSEDPFEKKKLAKQLVNAKQKLREARNKLDTQGDRLPAGVNSSLVEGKKRKKETLDEVLKRAQVSSASAGRFDKRIESEKVIDQGKRRKLLSSNISEEKNQTMKIMNSVLKGSSSVGKDSSKVVQIAPKKAAPKSKGYMKKQKEANRKRVR
jgi:regulator of ribosome biosynthesis